MSDEKQIIEQFDETILVKVLPKNATLPIDVVSEWSKGFRLVNVLIKELAKERYTDYVEDSRGDEHKITKINPLVLQLLKERRALEDQFWKFIGGEAVNEAKKETMKELARGLFNFNIDDKLKKEYEKDAILILEADMDEED